MKARGLVLGSILTTLTATASADDAKPEASAPKERVFGLGTVLGGGFTVATLTNGTGGSSSAGANGALLLPTIELAVYVTHWASINVSIPITNIVVASAVLGGIAFSGQALFEANVGSEDVHAVFGLGLGGDYANGSFFDTAISGGGLQIPAELGLEVVAWKGVRIQGPRSAVPRGGRFVLARHRNHAIDRLELRRRRSPLRDRLLRILHARQTLESHPMSITKTTVLFLMLCMSCKDEPKTNAAASASASASAPPTVASVAPSASASAEPVASRTDCPTGSNGPGTFGKPCEGSGSARMVELSFKGKYDEKSGGPMFNVHSKAPKTMLYGRVAVYFYDKAGKLIDVKEAPEGSDKTHVFHTCSGNIFAGGLAKDEKAAYNFSCMGKSNIPAGMASMEAEAFMVGFADSTVKKNEYYWRNNDLASDTRPKGGAK